MKLNYITVDTKLQNDCWAKALMFALNKPYSEIRNKLDWLVDIDGSLMKATTAGVLVSHDFTEQGFKGASVKELLNFFDTKRNVVVISIDSHVFFVYDGVIYDHIEDDEEFYGLLKEEVICVFYKQVSDYKLAKAAIQERLSEITSEQHLDHFERKPNV
jgi:hypothetical protein